MHSVGARVMGYHMLFYAFQNGRMLIDRINDQDQRPV
jgi:hypothetical protein